jgi:PAS domain S-box-containing protein
MTQNASCRITDQISLETYQQLFDNHTAIMLIVDPSNGEILFANRAAIKFYELKDEAPDFKSIQELIYSSLNQMTTSISNSDLNRCSGIESRHKTANGLIHNVELFSSEFKVNEKSYHHLIIHDITERKKTELALLESEEKFKRIVYSSPTAKYFYRLESEECLILTGANPSADRIIGINHETLIGKTFEQAFPSLAVTEIPSMYRKIARGELGTQLFEIPYSDERFTGYYEVKAFQTVPNCIAVDFVDITARKQSEDALRESEERYRTLADNGQALIWTSGIDKKCDYFNIPWLEFTGKSLEEELGDGWAKGVHPDDLQQCIDTYVNAFDCHEKFSMNYRIMHKSGEYRWIQDNGTPRYNSKGDFIGYIGHCLDITERLQAEEALSNVQKLESLGLLAGGIAHDFNNLLGGIFGYIDIAIESSNVEKVKEYLSKAINSIDRARHLTQQFLTFSKGGAPIQKIAPLFPFVQETVRFALSGSNVSCNFVIPSDLWNCNYDKNQIGQVIDNITINAQQAMLSGGCITVTANNVSIGQNGHLILKQGDYVRVSIKDAGVGIPPSQLSRIFDPFFTTKAKGHGLGLSTCYSIVKRHGGCIDVESEPGKGSTFHIYLPSSKQIAEELESIPQMQHHGSGTILIMDDEEVIRETISRILTDMGYSVVCRTNGNDAVNYVKSALKTGEPLKCLIFDLTVPGGMGGKEAVSEIRKVDNKIPIFVSSGYADDPVMKNPAAYGFTASICKPFRRYELMEIFENFLVLAYK